MACSGAIAWAAPPPLRRTAKAVARLGVGKFPVSRAAHVVGERHRAMFSSESGQADADEVEVYGFGMGITIMLGPYAYPRRREKAVEIRVGLLDYAPLRFAGE